ncbi:MAG: helix-turn-helix domain-containing protein [Anaerolineae bacterium]|jgi:transcriptional regulator with XRE-family HTH domain|nr:helix-turn-helix domain-containing protein [Anaerolineae bacterium]
MSTRFGELLREYRRRARLSQKDLAERTGYHPSYINRLERGRRMPPRQYGTIQDLAAILQLTQEETNALLAAAGLEPVLFTHIPAEADTPRLRRIIEGLVALHRAPGIDDAQIAFVEDAILLLLDSFSVARRTPPDTSFSEELVDDLLSAVITGSTEYGQDNLLTVLEEIARGDAWELKRRIAEALPGLLKANPSRALSLMHILRTDPPHPEWRTDIRRRVIEATPVLYKLNPEATPSLLRWHEGDEVYAILAALEALDTIGDERLQAELESELLSHVSSEQQNIVEFYVKLLEATRTRPDEALSMIESAKGGDRLTRTCITRCLACLLPTRPAEALGYMRFFLRREGGVPAEHQNVRRPLSRDLPQIIAVLDGYHAQAEEVIRELAQDEDVHIRRALSDILPALIQSHPRLALDLIRSYLIHDPDHYVRERTGKILPRLATLYPDEVRESCLALLRQGKKLSG